MIYTNNTKKAISLMFEKHKNQTDKSGLPYVFHPFHVAEQMTDENTTLVALMHDIVEDTDLTLEDLKNMGFPDEVIEALALMTHEKNQDYFEYVLNLSQNPIARKVKLADLEHNMDLTRLDEETIKQPKRMEKYQKYLTCYKFLKEIEDKNIIDNNVIKK